MASCLLTRAPIGAKKEDGTQKFVIRPYTPTSPPDAKGHFDLVSTARFFIQIPLPEYYILALVAVPDDVVPDELSLHLWASSIP